MPAIAGLSTPLLSSVDAKAEAEERRALPAREFAYIDSARRATAADPRRCSTRNALCALRPRPSEDEAARERARTKLLTATRKSADHAARVHHQRDRLVRRRRPNPTGIVTFLSRRTRGVHRPGAAPRCPVCAPIDAVRGVHRVMQSRAALGHEVDASADDYYACVPSRQSRPWRRRSPSRAHLGSGRGRTGCASWCGWASTGHPTLASVEYVRRGHMWRHELAAGKRRLEILLSAETRAPVERVTVSPRFPLRGTWHVPGYAAFAFPQVCCSRWRLASRRWRFRHAVLAAAWTTAQSDGGTGPEVGQCAAPDSSDDRPRTAASAPGAVG